MDFSRSRMPGKSFQVMSRRRVTWRDFSGMSDMEKSILALPNHRIDIPGKNKSQTRSKKQNFSMKIVKITDTMISYQSGSNENNVSVM